MAQIKTKTIYFASSNKDKLKEIKSILKLSASAFKKKRIKLIVKLAPFGFTVSENKKTFIGNAYKKASTLAKRLKKTTFADDSGIEVFGMGRKPGVKSARFFRGGKALNEIVNKIKKKKDKRACFTCAIVVCNENGRTIFKTQKSWYGKITDKPRGKNGFGYDPIFLVPKLNKTPAELSSKIKNKISHRAMAVRELAEWFQ